MGKISIRIENLEVCNLLPQFLRFGFGNSELRPQLSDCPQYPTEGALFDGLFQFVKRPL